LKADLRGLFTDAKAVGRHRLEEVQGGVSETVQAARRFEQETVEALREQIEDHPWGSLAAAFCAGIFAGSFFSKRG
jgi:ElaB/YqjD/DUF883 family membrane-anchored ribosome-binding protein